MMGNYEKRRKFVDNLVKTLMVELEFDTSSWIRGLPDPDLAEALYRNFSDTINYRLRNLHGATLGKIAACGRGGQGRSFTVNTTLYQVHRRQYLNAEASGDQLLRMIAVTTVIAMMTDIIESARKT
jgi:hypothetical protein